MEQNCLAGAKKSGLRSRTLYRVAAVGIATLITQASPGGAASSWGVECLTTNLETNSYCVTSLNDEIPTGDANWTLRKSVEDANTRAAASATIGFQDALFGIQRSGAGAVVNNSQTESTANTNPTNEDKIVLNSTLEIRTNITIAAPTDKDGRILLTIERGNAITSGSPLISVNPAADPASVPAADPASVPAANQAITEIKIENVTIQSRANEANPQDASGTFATPGVAIQVASTTVPGDNVTTVTPDVVLKSSQVLNAVSESGGAAINTPGNVRVESSTLVGNVAMTPSGGAPTDGGAIKAGGTVTVVSSALNNNSASGNGGAISASSVTVSNAENSSNSQLNGNTAGGSGGAISTEGTVSVSDSNLAGNAATAGSGGAISTSGATSTVEVANSGLVNNTAGGNGGAISATGESSIVAVTNSGLGNNTAAGNGGAISASGTTGAVSVTNSSLGLNTANGDGGAVAAGGAVTVGSSSVLVSNSSTSGNGGAITAGGDVTIVNSGLASNTASGAGGAISATGTTSAVEVTNSGLAGNTAGGSGGAISVTGATSAVKVTNSVLAFNTATSGNGGAIAATGESSSVSITNSGLGYNFATSGNGGAVAATGATSAVQISDSSIAENRAGKNGGGISSGGEVTIGSNSSTPVNAPSAGSIDSQLSTSESRTTSESTFSASTSISLTLGSNVYSTSAGQGNSGPSDSATNSSGSIMFKNIASSGNGGAISAQGEVTVTSGSKIYANTANQDGGAISSQSTVEISNSAVSGNTATTGNGGAISTGGQVSASASTLNGNEAQEGYGGAIYAGAAINLSDTEFFSNTAFESGGAIYAEGNVAVIDSVFGINVESDVEAQEEPETQSNVAYLGQGGAIYSEGNVTTTRSAFVQNFSGSGGGAIAAEQTVSVNGSIFVGNGSFGDGGAVYATGGVIVENGSVLLANTAGVNPESEFGFGFLYPIFLDGPVYFDMEISGGNGGAIYSEGDVRVSGSNIGAAPPGADAEFTSVFANKALCAQSFWQDGDDSGWDQECEFYEYNDNSQFGYEYSEVASVGNGGGIYALGKVTIEGGNTTINIDLDVLSLLDIFIAKELSFEKSYLTNNYAQNNGGAVYALGGARVDNAVFGTEPVENPNYNPIIGYSQNPNYSPDENIDNPSFNPYVQATNPEYNPSVWVENPNYNVLVPTQLPNPNYDASIPQQIRNVDCPTGSTIYEGAEFGSGICEYTINNSDGSISYVQQPLYVPNPEYDGREFLDNPQYDDREFVLGLLQPGLPENNIEFISILANPDLPNDENAYVPNPNQDTREELPQLKSADSPQDDYKYIYGGNSSGYDGGAIYVEGSTLITNSTFSGNTSGEDGGAIYSEGSLEIKDSLFDRNWAEDDGGAVRATPGDGDLFITRTSFTENVAMDDGGAIDISTGGEEHYDDVILASLFRGNEAFGQGGAIDSGYVVLILNTFEDNKSPEGESLNLSGGHLSGNVLIGSLREQDLCFIDSFSRASSNYATDESCFEGSGNYVLPRDAITAEGAIHILPAEFESTLLGALKGTEEFYLVAPNDDSPNGELAPLGTFITNELNKDFKSEIRDSAVLWTAGHLQGVFPKSPIAPEDDNSEGDTEIVQPKDKEEKSQEKNSGSINQVVVNQPDSNNLDSPVLIFEPTLSAEELARISLLRTEQLAAEKLRVIEAERIAAENVAKINAAKLARDKARALAAEKRRAQLAALKAKIAETHARGEALKRKPSWINLMKNSPKSNAAKKLVKVPNK